MVIRLRSGWNILWALAAAATSSSRLVAVHRGYFPFIYQVHSFTFGSYSINSRRTGTILRPQQEQIPALDTRRRRIKTRMASLNSSTSPPTSSSPALQFEFVDIGANLLDEKYTDGIYFGKKRHEPDFDEVLARAVRQGVTHIILTAGTLAESRKAVNLVQEYRTKWEDAKTPPPLFLGCTVGVHPTRCQQEFIDNLEGQTTLEISEDSSSPTSKTADFVLDELLTLMSYAFDRGYIVAIGEIGLDYDRLQFSPKDVQIDFFKRQLDYFLYGDHPDIGSLPLFLHNRSVGTDVLDILKENREKVNFQSQKPVPIKGVVHSFDDTIELAQEFIDLGLYIGLNGCSLKTEENLAVVRELPLERILLETDCPYCEIKATHAGHQYVTTTFPKKADKKFEFGTMVKGRNEPCQLVQVAEVIAGVKGISVQDVAETCYKNSMNLYGSAFSSKKCATIQNERKIAS